MKTKKLNYFFIVSIVLVVCAMMSLVLVQNTFTTIYADEVLVAEGIQVSTEQELRDVFASGNDQVVSLTADITTTSTNIVLEKGSLTILGNGHVLCVYGIEVKNDAVLSLGQEEGDVLVVTSNNNNTDALEGKGIISLQDNATLNIFAGTTLGHSTAGSEAAGINAKNNATIYMFGGVITDCESTAGAAGAIELSDKAQFNMGDGEISNCVGTKGGAVGVAKADAATVAFEMFGGVITNCESTVYGGGAVCFTANKSVTFNMYGGIIDSCTAKDAKTYAYGGAIFMLTNDIFYMEGGEIKNCSAKNGAALYAAKPSKVTIKGQAKIYRNEASEEGTIYVTNAPALVVEGEVEIFNNKAKSAGAIYCSGNCTIGGNAKLYNNTATERGGAICANTGTLTIQNRAKLYNNRTEGWGGAIASLAATVNLKDSGSIYNNEAKLGGGVYIYSTNMLKVTGGEIYSNTAVEGGAIYTNNARSKVVISNGVFRDNEAQKGGFIYNKGTVELANCYIDSNIAEEGGAIYNAAGQVTIKDALIGNNIANFGSGVYAYEGTVIATKESVISGNFIMTTSEEEYKEVLGAGIYNRGAFVAIEAGAEISNNFKMLLGNDEYLAIAPSDLYNHYEYNAETGAKVFGVLDLGDSATVKTGFEGYEIDGWYKAAWAEVAETELSAEYHVASQLISEPTEALELIAFYGRYVVEFEANNEEEIEDQVLISGGKIAIPRDPSKDNSIFAGWVVEGTNEAYDLTTPVHTDIKFVARWEEDVNGNGINDLDEEKYSIEYVDGAEGTVFDDYYVDSLIGVDTPKFVGYTARPGYVFEGWTPSIATKVDGNVVYTAIWAVDVNGNGIADEEEVGYNVDYVDGVDGYIFNDQYYADILPGLTIPEFVGIPSREGYTFKGWDIQEAENGDVTYTAIWEKDGIKELRKLNFKKDLEEISNRLERGVNEIEIVEEGENNGLAIILVSIFVSIAVVASLVVIYFIKKQNKRI